MNKRIIREKYEVRKYVNNKLIIEQYNDLSVATSKYEKAKKDSILVSLRKDGKRIMFYRACFVHLCKR